MKFPHGVSVHRHRAELATDPYSGELTRLDWSRIDCEIIDDCAIAPVTSSESPTVERERLNLMRTVYLPYGADVLAGDRLVFDCREWLVDGDAVQWLNPYTGRQAGAVVRVERMEPRG